ncbi:hypothetical protein D9M72_401490 [compost metagenome]
MFAAEVGEADFHYLIVLAEQRQARLDRAAAAAVLQFQVPAAHLLAAVVGGLAPAEADRAVGRDDLAGGIVDLQCLPLGMVGFAEVVGEVRGAQEVIGHQRASVVLVLAQQHQHRHVGVLLDVVAEVGGLAVGVEFLQHHVAHGHRQCGVGALLRRQPDVAELDHLAEVGRDGDSLGALVADFGIEVRVWRARLRHVGAPHHQVGRVVPVGRFGHVGLFAPDLRAGRRQVAVPVVERQAGAAEQAQVARAGGVRDHRHGRDRREADHAVRAELLYGESVGRGDHLGGGVPVGAHEAALAAHALVARRLLRVLADRFPGGDRVHGLAGLAPHLHQAAADHRVLDALRGVDVPAVRGAARAAARLMVGQVRARARIVGLLGLPRDQAVLHVDLPRAGAGAVHAVGRAHDLVVLPAAAVAVFPLAVFMHDRAMAVRESGRDARHELQSIQEMTHLLVLREAFLRRSGGCGSVCRDTLSLWGSGAAANSLVELAPHGDRGRRRTRD